MMIHDKILSGQFLLDLKNDRSTSFLHQHHHHHHHQPSHLAQHAFQQQLPSPPMPDMKMDLYSAYAYQQQLQQQLIGHNLTNLSANHQTGAPALTPPAEVLDLSRRCDSVENSRKTPSPYQTNSNFGSPVASPSSSTNLANNQNGMIPTNLLYSAQAAAGLYPNLYYPQAVKQEPMNISPPPIANGKQLSPAGNGATGTPQLPVAATSLLQTFATAAAAAALNANEPTSTAIEMLSPSTKSSNNITKVGNGNGSAATNAAAPLLTSPTSSTAVTALAALDKSTRPFKAFPRDPLVIAANFAATDVLLDNPRVERYTEYRKRVLEQIRNSNGGSRTVTNPKMRRTNSRSGSINDAISSSNHHYSENEEQRHSTAAEESSDCESNAGNFDKIMTSSTSSTSSIESSTSSTLTHNNISTSSNESNSVNVTNTSSGAALTSGSGSISSCGQIKDAAYYERRRKNNAAAKKSRDRRRIKEDEIAIRAAYLERQNIELLCQIDALKAQLAVFTSKVGA